ncbi:hypothetical protein [Marivita sp. GX14005]|uniref:hypothetical protein n=1 Tax=Marivita sp. GX14005 TaxID=2942276 RepID=UPI0020186162|nr:hypothetical protein [Marivita sp. GX14005]MCL3881545.1 hypothetical protein [Marivita sp. GX14005]
MRRFISITLLSASPLLADPPVIEAASHDGGRVAVTLSHPDTGWDHYADGWRIETAQGEAIATRELLHPHVEEQPFTRSLFAADLPEEALFIRAKCSVDGWNEDTVPLVR